MLLDLLVKDQELEIPSSENVIFCPWLDAATPGGMAKSSIFNSTQSTYHCTIQDAINLATGLRCDRDISRFLQ